jgi:hypothetical protein
MEDKFTLGGDASVMAGPVGRSAEARTDAMMRAEILSWSRSRGIFAGVSLRQIRYLATPQSTANEQGQQGAIAFAFELRDVGCVEVSSNSAQQPSPRSRPVAGSSPIST